METLISLAAFVLLGVNSATPSALPNSIDVANVSMRPQVKTTEENPEKKEPSYMGWGHDVSWPNCEVSLPKQDFGIVGVNNGTPFTHNPCFRQQYEWASSTHSASIYMNLDLNPNYLVERGKSGPYGDCSGEDYSCLIQNYGYNAAKHAHEHAKENGANDSAMWWLDIETLNTWTDSFDYNRLSIDGAVRYFQDKNMNVGIYSTPMLWKEITGDYKNGLPAWPAIITDKPHTGCGVGFTGGKTLIVQYNQEVIDKNFACA